MQYFKKRTHSCSVKLASSQMTERLKAVEMNQLISFLVVTFLVAVGLSCNCCFLQVLRLKIIPDTHHYPRRWQMMNAWRLWIFHSLITVTQKKSYWENGGGLGKKAFYHPGSDQSLTVTVRGSSYCGGLLCKFCVLLTSPRSNGGFVAPCSVSPNFLKVNNSMIGFSC